MRHLLALPLAVVGAFALYYVAGDLDPDSPFRALHDAPVLVVVLGSVILALASGVVSAARDWNEAWRRVAPLGAAVVALAGFMAGCTERHTDSEALAEAIWTVTVALAVPAAALTLWTWIRLGASRPDDVGFWVTTTRIGLFLSRFRIPVAVALGAVLAFPLGAIILTDGTSGFAELLAVVALSGFVIAVFTQVPAAILALSASAPGRREWGAVGLGALAIGSVLAVGLVTERSLLAADDPMKVAAGIGFTAWIAVVVFSVVVTVAHAVARIAGWIRDGFSKPRPA